MKNLSLGNIAKAVNGTLFGADSFSEAAEAAGVVIDSRKVEENYLFIAVKGERVDGHNFIEDVFAKKALCVICEKKPDDKSNGMGSYILVESSLQALKDIAAFYRESLDIKIVGITGSVGKTSTKEFIASVLEQNFRVLKTEGNFNNEIGVPLTLLSIRDYHEVAVVEMGISDFGEMHRLSYMVKPDVCVMTNIGLCHLENLGSRDGILKAKSEIFDFATENCYAVLNKDDDKLSTIPENHAAYDCLNKVKKYIFYGMQKGENKGDVFAENIKTNGIYGTESTICFTRVNGTAEKIEVSFSLPGRHMVYNAMAAIAVGSLFDMNSKDMKRGIENIKSVGSRLNIVETGKYTVIDDCYNANPVSMKSSIDVLDSADTRKVAILGDMFELGADEKKLHYGVGAYLGEKMIDTAFLVGTLSENIYQGLKDSNKNMECYYYNTVEDLLMFLDLMVKQGDTILVKASHAMHFERIVERLREL
ncbi:MAG: UDP-N-acetylmuramoyl-tripeptide--D-alanyl-D-alanine ligase [Lachnospiraceae bacterium]|nr:UDP-N-acetylmuramoyl-tripeptide--D-alanyl-D-alanine ligase [Lachnospiraceae bacterium]